MILNYYTNYFTNYNELIKINTWSFGIKPTNALFRGLNISNKILTSHSFALTKCTHPALKKYLEHLALVEHGALCWLERCRYRPKLVPRVLSPLSTRAWAEIRPRIRGWYQPRYPMMLGVRETAGIKLI